jgi:glucuronoarabinoxylan endo-1,4-beta-xylanase
MRSTPLGTVTSLFLYGEVPSSTNAAYYIDDLDVQPLISPNPTNGQCTVNWTNVFQHIDGFGASSAWGGGWTTNQADMFFSTNSGMGTSVDGTTNFAFNGIGLSLLRSRIAPDGTTGESSIMQMAQARGARVWSTPWSPPAIYKSTNSVNGGSFVSSPANYQGYANQLAGYVASMKVNYGINLYAISVQNEPDENTTYESCLWTAQQFHDFVPYLAEALTNLGVASTRIMMPEDANWDSDYSLATTAMTDPSTAAQVGIVAAHDYGGSDAVLNNYGKSLWETEVSTFDPYDGSISNGLYWAMQIHDLLTIGQVNAWHFWWFIPYATDNESLVDTNGLPAKRMYVLGQYSRFVRPGYYRIGATNNGATSISAYKDPASGNFAIVAINTNGANFTQTFNLAGFNCITVTPWITSGTLSLASQPAINLTNASFTYTLPPASVVTFVGQAIATSFPTVTATLTGKNLILSWPTDHTGWTLFSQTNNLNNGVSANINDWVRLANSATTNQVVIPMSSTQSGGYFRLVYP